MRDSKLPFYIRLFAAEPPADTGGGGDTDADAGDVPKGETEPAQEDADTQGGLPDDPEALKSEIAKLRRENAKRRVDAKEAKETILDEIAQALGLKEDQAPTVESLQTALSESTGQKAELEARATMLARENAVIRAATTAGADADMLLDSQKFMASLEDVDPTDTKKVGETIKAWITDNPKYGATQAVTPSTVEHGGGTEPKTSYNQFLAMPAEERFTFAATEPELFKEYTERFNNR